MYIRHTSHTFNTEGPSHVVGAGLCGLCEQVVLLAQIRSRSGRAAQGTTQHRAQGWAGRQGTGMASHVGKDRYSLTIKIIIHVTFLSKHSFQSKYNTGQLIPGWI